MLQTLVAAPSVSSVDKTLDQSNQLVIGHLASWLTDVGFDVEVLPVSADGEKSNLIATLGSGSGGVVLSGHTDTVPTDENRWQSEPWDVTQREERAYGLGVCDMKGFFPAAIAAASAVDPARLKKPLRIVATADEESTMAGARSLAKIGRPRADVAVIGEPTDLQPIFAHKGIVMLRFHTTGVAGHSSDPEVGANALDVMHTLMSEVLAFRSEMQANNKNPAFKVQYPTMNLGCLHAGDSPNRICSSAELIVDLRLLPGMDPDATISEIESLVARVEDESKTEVRVERTFDGVSPFQTEVNSPLFSHISKQTGRQPTTVSFGTEATYFQQLGAETVVVGAGSIDQAHQANEYLDLRQLDPLEELLGSLIHEYCVATA